MILTGVITATRVRETILGRSVLSSEEIKLIDLQADELLEKLLKFYKSS
jgi:hypothetical protein